MTLATPADARQEPGRGAAPPDLRPRRPAHPRRERAAAPGERARARTAGVRASALRLTVVPTPRHGRLGVAWAVATGAALAGGPWPLAVWMAVCGSVGVAAAARTWRTPEAGRVWIGGALLTALAGPLAAAGGGPGSWAVVLLAGLALSVLPVQGRIVGAVRTLRGGKVATPDQSAALGVTALGLAVPLGTGALVLLAADSITLAGLVLGLVCCFDASRYVVGTGAPVPWEGTVAGAVATASATLFVVVLQPTPVSGHYPWVLGLVVVAAGIAGRRALRVLDGPGAGAGAPGPLRRLDTLLLAAPLWLLVCAVGGIGRL